MTTRTFPDVQMDNAARQIQEVLKANNLGGAVILVSPKCGGMMLVEPEGWYRKNTPDVTMEERMKFGHYMTCMHQISSKLHDLYHEELAKLGAFDGPNKEEVWH